MFTLREKCPNAGLFWSVFSCIRTEYGDLLRQSYFNFHYFLTTFVGANPANSKFLQ